MAGFTGSGAGDIFTGGVDSDQALGNGGNDTLTGNGGSDNLAGNAGADSLDGGDGDDWLYSGDRSGSFNLPYYGNSFTPPVLDTGTEADSLIGGAGDDRLFAGYGDFVDGGGNGYTGDYLYISFLGAPSGISADFRQVSQTIGGAVIANIDNISWVQGSNFNDSINVGNSSANGYSDFTAVFGAGGNDHLVAGYYTGVLYGEDGDDVVDGRGSQYLQRVDGGAGNDTLYTESNGFGSAYGGDGDDLIYAHGEVHGGNGNDRIEMQTTYYTSSVYGDAGNDLIKAVAEGNPNAYGNVIAGGSGADSIIGGANGDALISGDLTLGSVAPDAGLEHDILNGAGGDDRLAAGYGDDVNGGAGSDILSLSLAGATSGVSINLTGISGTTPYAFAGGTIGNIEMLDQLTGSGFADTIIVGTQPGLLVIDGGSGDDMVTSAGSSVEFNGGAGDDWFVSGAAGDVFRGGDGFDTVDYSAYTTEISVALASASQAPGGDLLLQIEQVIATGLADSITGGLAAEALMGAAGHDTLSGGGGNDTLTGGTGDDRLDGGSGADKMTGDAGNDVYAIDDAGDRVVEGAGGGLDRVVTTASWVLGAGQEVEQVVAAGAGAIDLAGNELDNLLEGNGAANALTGLDGADSMSGGDGNDTLDGGAGNDEMAGGAGNDIYYVGSLLDKVSEEISAGTDLIFARVTYSLGQYLENLTLLGTARGGTGNALDNVVIGNSVGNELAGGGGNDWLDGGAEADNLIGGDGHDALLGGDGADSLAGGNGNDHLFGQSSNGGLDGADSLNGGDGSDYLQGNAGNDTLDGAEGSDRINGGADADIIRGGDGNDTANGNLGNDTLDGANGNDSLRGGRGDDSISGGAGNDILSGDVGADTLNGGAGIDFFLFAGNASLHNGQTADIVTDFEDAIDRLSVGYAVDALMIGSPQSSFADAAARAQQLFDEHAGGNEVAAITVGGNSYIFFSSNNGAAADSAIKIMALDATAFSTADFL